MKAGERVILTSGEHDDYTIVCEFTVLRDFSFDLAMQRYEAVEKARGTKMVGLDAMIASFCQAGYIAMVEFREVNVSMSYFRTDTSNPAKDEDDEPAPPRQP